MDALRHHFIHGVRADTDLQYRAISGRRTQWQNLHLPPIFDDCALTIVLQSMMVLHGLPRFHADRLHRPKTNVMRRLIESADGPPSRDLDSALDRYLAQVPTLTSERLEVGAAEALGNAAAQLIATGALPVVRIAGRVRDYFAIVTGVEIAPATQATRALLLLDAYASAPWVSFFNAKLILHGRTCAAPTDMATPTAVYRLLDGEVQQVRLLGLWAIRRAQPP